MKPIIITLLFVFLLFPVIKAQNAREIIKKSTDAIYLESMEMTLTLKIFDSKGNIRERKVKNSTKKFGETIKTKILFLSPADVAGTSMIIYDYEKKDDDMWIYLPSMRNTRRIVSSDKGKNFMGSEFANSDLSKPDPDDFNFRILESKKIDEKECWQIESVCLNDKIEKENGYNKSVSFLEKTHFLPLLIHYYDANGILLKTMTFSDYRPTSQGKYFAYGLEKKNARNGRRSEMRVDDLKPGTRLNESDFSITSLAR